MAANESIHSSLQDDKPHLPGCIPQGVEDEGLALTDEPRLLKELPVLLRQHFDELDKRLQESIRRELQGLAAKGSGFTESAPIALSPHPWSTRHMRRFSRREITDELNEEEDEQYLVSLNRGKRFGQCKSGTSGSLKSVMSDNVPPLAAMRPSSSHATNSLDSPKQLSTSEEAGEVGQRLDEKQNEAVGSGQLGRNREQHDDAPDVQDAPCEPLQSVVPVGGVESSALTEAVRSKPPLSIKHTAIHVNEKLDRAVGLDPKGGPSTPLGATPSQKRVQAFVRSNLFEQLMIAVVMLQTILVGVQIDVMAKSRATTPPMIYRITDVMICVVFSFELLLRLYVHRCHFFFMYGWVFNILDLFLVLSQIVEEILISSTYTVGSGINFSVLRAVRMLRCVRIMRVLRLTRFFDDLRRLVAAIIYSMTSFLWSFLFVFMLIYIYGIYLTHSVHLHLLENGNSGPGSDELQKWFGTVAVAILSLFECLTGGVDWHDIVEVLIKYLHPGWGVATALWIAFLLIAVMNIITGNFVQTAINLSQRVISMDHISHARQLFKCLDINENGIITVDEIHNHLETEAVQDFFRSIDIDTSEAKSLFDILDISGDGQIDWEEFVNGCMRLQGQARAIDVVLMTVDNRRGFEHSAHMLTTLLAHVQEMHETVRQVSRLQEPSKSVDA